MALIYHDVEQEKQQKIYMDRKYFSRYEDQVTENRRLQPKEGMRYLAVHIPPNSSCPAIYFLCELTTHLSCNWFLKIPRCYSWAGFAVGCVREHR